MRYSSELELSGEQLRKKVVGEEAGKFREVGRHYLWVSLYRSTCMLLVVQQTKSQYCCISRVVLELVCSTRGLVWDEAFQDHHAPNRTCDHLSPKALKNDVNRDT